MIYLSLSFSIELFTVENQDIPESITDITNETVMDCEFSEEIAFEGCQATTEISVLYDGVPFGNVLEKESSDDYISDLGNFSFHEDTLNKYFYIVMQSKFILQRNKSFSSQTWTTSKRM